MKNRITNIIAIFLSLITLGSCHTLRSITSTTEKKEAALRRVVKLSQIKATALKVNYLAKANYQGTVQSLSGVIDISSDTSARITATSGFGLPLARITISGDSAHVHSMLFEDFTIDNGSLLPGARFSLTPAVLKDLLLGNLIFINDTISLDDYSLNLHNDTLLILQYRIPSKKNPELSQFNNTAIFSLNSGKILKNNFWFDRSDAQILIDYRDFTFVNNKKVPTRIKFTVVQGLDTTMTAQIKVKKIRLQ